MSDSLLIIQFTTSESSRLNSIISANYHPKPPNPKLILNPLKLFHLQLNLIKPKTGIRLKPKKTSKKSTKQLDFDPREKQKLLDGKPVKVFKRGEQLFVKINEKLDEQKSQKQQDEKQIRKLNELRKSKNFNLSSSLSVLYPPSSIMSSYN